MQLEQITKVLLKKYIATLKSVCPKLKKKKGKKKLLNMPAGNWIFFQSIAVECFREMLSINRESYWGQTELF